MIVSKDCHRNILYLFVLFLLFIFLCFYINGRFIVEWDVKAFIFMLSSFSVVSEILLMTHLIVLTKSM